MDDISLPTAYYMQEQNAASVQSKIDEYFKHGDFLLPLIVEKRKRGYILREGFDQFSAAQELNISECLCQIV